MFTPATAPEGKEGMLNPQEVRIGNVGTVLGQGNPVVHLRSGYNQKNIPEYFTYRAITLDELQDQVRSYGVEPKLFFSAQMAADYIRDNSLFAPDTYVLNPPGTTVFFVYQFSVIRNIKALLNGTAFSNSIMQILDRRNLSIYHMTQDNGGSIRSPYDSTGLRKPEWTGFDDEGRVLPKLSNILLGGYLSIDSSFNPKNDTKK